MRGVVWRSLSENKDSVRNLIAAIVDFVAKRRLESPEFKPGASSPCQMTQLFPRVTDIVAADYVYRNKSRDASPTGCAPVPVYFDPRAPGTHLFCHTHSRPGTTHQFFEFKFRTVRRALPRRNRTNFTPGGYASR